MCIIKAILKWPTYCCLWLSLISSSFWRFDYWINVLFHLSENSTQSQSQSLLRVPRMRLWEKKETKNNGIVTTYYKDDARHYYTRSTQRVWWFVVQNLIATLNLNVIVIQEEKEKFKIKYRPQEHALYINSRLQIQRGPLSSCDQLGGNYCMPIPNWFRVHASTVTEKVRICSS